MLNQVETERLAQIAVSVCEGWLMLDLDESIIGDRVYGALEHLIHEMSHAASLGLEWNKDTSEAIGDALNGDGGTWARPRGLAIAEESRAWAISWNIWQFFALPFEWGDLAAAADIQECEPGEIEQLSEHHYIIDLATQTFERLVKFLNDYEKEQQQ